MNSAKAKVVSGQSANDLVGMVKQVFGKAVEFDEVGLFCLVHLDHPKAAERKKRVDEFTPYLIFDKSCPHCRPFLEQGAYVLFTKDGPYGLRLLPDNTYEMVGLCDTPPAKSGA